MASREYGSISEGRELEVASAETQKLSSSDFPPSHFDKRRVFQCAIAIAIVVLVYVATSPRMAYFKEKKRHHAASRARFYDDQIVDHNAADSSETYSQKYYEETAFFGGAGHPIFVIIGGEDALDRILYPFISDHLGKQFSAYTVCVEHRFYGDSFPVRHHTNADLRKLLSPAQALSDTIRLIKFKQKELGCGPRGSPDYCPVMAVGGSYPGFLSALMRIVYPDVVDIGYASSAPLYLYSHDVDQSAYYEKITQVADAASPGCAEAVKTTLMEVQELMLTSDKGLSYLATKLGICTKTFPDYITDAEIFSQEVMMVIASHFAEDNMGYYPPTQHQELVQGCKIFQNKRHSAAQRVSAFLRMREGFKTCFDMMSELPPGPNGTISASDWSGVGDGNSGLMWDFQSCSLIPECGMSEHSMFPPRKWTLEWLTEHCQSRFRVTPNPLALVDEFGFDNLTTASRLLFTNGDNDGWSVTSILEDVPESVKALNFVNGAHHSDLTHTGPSEERDTQDIKEGHIRIAGIVDEWLKQIREEQE